MRKELLQPDIKEYLPKINCTANMISNGEYVPSKVMNKTRVLLLTRFIYVILKVLVTGINEEGKLKLIPNRKEEIKCY